MSTLPPHPGPLRRARSFEKQPEFSGTPAQREFKRLVVRILTKRSPAVGPPPQA